MKEIKELKEYNRYEATGLLLQDEVDAMTIVSHTDLSIAEWVQKKAQQARLEIEKVRVSLVKPYNDIVSQINAKAKELILPIETAENKTKIKILSRRQEEEKRRQEKEKDIQEKILLIKKTTNEEELQELIIWFWDIEDNRIYTACEIQNIEFEKIRKEAEEKKIREEEEKKLLEMREEKSEAQAKLEAEKIDLERQQRDIERQKEELEQQKLEKEIKEKETMPVQVKGARQVMKFEITDENLIPRILCSPDEKKIREIVKNWTKEIPWVKIWEETAIY